MSALTPGTSRSSAWPPSSAASASGPQIAALRSGADLVIATPGRLLDLMGQRFGDFSKLEFPRARRGRSDARHGLPAGHPPHREISPARPPDAPLLGHLPAAIEALTKEFLREPRTVEIGRRANPAETVTQIVYEVPKHLRGALLSHLLKDPKMDSVLIFSRTKHGADKIARVLERDGITVATLHANRSQNQRLRALSEFKSGAVRVLVATDIASRGIDVDGTRMW